MTQTVLRYGKASQQRIGPYIVISKRKLPTKAQQTSPSENSFKPLENQEKSHDKGAMASSKNLKQLALLLGLRLRMDRVYVSVDIAEEARGE